MTPSMEGLTILEHLAAHPESDFAREMTTWLRTASDSARETRVERGRLNSRERIVHGLAAVSECCSMIQQRRASAPAD